MLRVKEIVKEITPVKVIGNNNQQIDELVQLTDSVKTGQLCWCSEKNMDKLAFVKQGVIICSKNSPDSAFNPDCTYILVNNPRLAFKKVIETFFAEKNIEFVIEKTAQIHSSSKIAERVKIGHNAVVEASVEIGEGTIIGHNTVILKGTKIGENVKIGANTTIGGTGFGYEKEEDGQFALIAHIGNVVIEDNAEIGNNTTIDRAVIGSTRIGKNVKIDNLVHIAHGVEIGENSLIIANAMVAGSAKIGKSVWVAPSSSILNKVSIGDNATIGVGAVVLKDVAQNDIVAGIPAKSIKK